MMRMCDPQAWRVGRPGPRELERRAALRHRRAARRASTDAFARMRAEGDVMQRWLEAMRRPLPAPPPPWWAWLFRRMLD